MHRIIPMPQLKYHYGVKASYLRIGGDTEIAGLDNYYGPDNAGVD